MLGPDSGIGSARVVVARRAVSLLSNRIFGVRTIRMQDLCCGTILHSWTKNTLIGFCSGECPLACGAMPPILSAMRTNLYRRSPSASEPGRVTVLFSMAHDLSCFFGVGSI